MSRIEIHSEFAKKHNISLAELSLLHTLGIDSNYKKMLENLSNNDYIYYNKQQQTCFLNPKGVELITDSLAYNPSNEDKYKEIAIELKSIFPKGKKNGSAYYWTEAVSLIVKRLQLFEKKYGVYSKEDIIDATQRYVNSFNGNTLYMKTLKYFIFSEKPVNGMIEPTSELLNFISNKEEECNSNEDWTQTLR